jgi:hypothetical protein
MRHSDASRNLARVVLRVFRIAAPNRVWALAPPSRMSRAFESLFPARGSAILALDNFRVIRCTGNKVNSEVPN